MHFFFLSDNSGGLSCCYEFTVGEELINNNIFLCDGKNENNTTLQTIKPRKCNIFIQKRHK